MDTFKGKWDNFGATEHTLTRHGQQFNWVLPKAIARESDFRNNKILTKNLKRFQKKDKSYKWR